MIEYSVCEFTSATSRQQFEDELNDKGASGYELVTTCEVDPQNHRQFAILQRQARQP